MNLPLTSDPFIRSVQSFYHLQSGALHGACCGMACFVARHLNPKRWAMAEAQAEKIVCLGQCFAAPAMVNGDPRPHAEVRSQEGIVLSRVARGGARTLNGYMMMGGYKALPASLAFSPEEIVAAVEFSGLRGRGGAGFSTGRKWRNVASQPSGLKFVVANADEGDSGAYIDRFLMEDDPFALIEAMTIAAYAVGACEGWIYLRAEYPQAKESLERALAEARQRGFLGKQILGSNLSFDVHIHIGQGSYVCGEESAMLQSIEGRRPEPQVRPPFTSERGLYRRPTLVNNVETFVNIPWIILQGAEAYRALGITNSRGTKVLSLNSLFKTPGLYEVEFGVTVRHIVEELGGGLRNGGKLKGVIIGGPLAGIIPPQLLDTPLGFEELHAIGASVGHGGVIAFDKHTSIAELMRHVFSFGACESCGKCTPCRLGSRAIEQLFQEIVRNGPANYWQKEKCEKILAALKMTSLCGLGTGLAEFAESVFRYYGEELDLCFR